MSMPNMRFVLFIYRIEMQLNLHTIPKQRECAFIGAEQFLTQVMKLKQKEE